MALFMQQHWMWICYLPNRHFASSSVLIKWNEWFWIFHLFDVAKVKSKITRPENIVFDWQKRMRMQCMRMSKKDSECVRESVLLNLMNCSMRPAATMIEEEKLKWLIQFTSIINDERKWQAWAVYSWCDLRGPKNI